MPFILNEDEALKTALTGITVADDANPTRPVGVWFGQPDLETREQKYPYLTIHLIDLNEALDRAMRNVVTLGYVPEGDPAAVNGISPKYEYPIPYNLDYQVRVWARHPRHDRAIVAELIRNRLPARYGSLYVPQDNTIRSMFMTGMVKRDSTEQQRRLFSTVFNVRVFSELTQSVALAATKTLSVNLTVSNTNV